MRTLLICLSVILLSASFGHAKSYNFIYGLNNDFDEEDCGCIIYAEEDGLASKLPDYCYPLFYGQAVIEIGIGSFEAISEFIELLQKEHPEIDINITTLRKYISIEEESPK